MTNSDMLGTLAYITLAACYLLAPVSGSGKGTDKTLTDRAGAHRPGHISTQTHTQMSVYTNRTGARSRVIWQQLCGLWFNVLTP